jgi:hypothetical protein
LWCFRFFPSSIWWRRAMAENICRNLAVDASGHCRESATKGTDHGRKRPGVKRPSPRAVNGVLEWIDEAQSTQSTWARNALVVVGLVGVLLWLALRLGLLGP